MRIAIVGPGRMGQAVVAAAAKAGHEISAEVKRGELTPDALNGAAVAIEFTTPEEAAQNLTRLAEFGVPTVCGTTGWYDRLPDVANVVQRNGAALVYAPNFSLGVQILLHLARAVGGTLRERPEFDAYLVERHHREKRDAPSGTARALRDVLTAQDPSREYPVTSIRAGAIPGTHEIHIDAGGESLAVTHTVRDRSIFAQGALVAAEWITAQPRRGVFTFDHVLFGEDA